MYSRVKYKTWMYIFETYSSAAAFSRKRWIVIYYATISN